jgi:uncharacterized sulfatase
MKKLFVFPVVFLAAVSIILAFQSYIRLKVKEFFNSDKPNIIFIMLDDLGYSQVAWTSQHVTEDDYDPLFLKHTLDRGDYSPEKALEFARRSTPTLSRMAKTGATFTNAYTPSNLCAPSRIGIATGVFQNRWGMYRNIDTEAHGFKPDSHLAERLNEIGYATAHIGKWHMGPRDETMVAKFMEKHGIEATDGVYPPMARHPEVRRDMYSNGYMGSTAYDHHALNNGFDYYFGYNMWESPFYNADNVWENFSFAGINPQYNSDLFTDKAIIFIEESIQQGKPFYVQLHYHAVHAPLDPKAPDRYYDVFDSESFVLNNFYAHVFAIDENVRRLEELLEKEGLAENTIIVFTSDNGGSIGGRSTLPGNAPYRGQKGTYFLGGIRVPLIFYWPDGIKKAIVSDHLVSALDILPTVVDAAGGRLPEGLDGKSLVPLLKGKSNEPVRDYLLWSGIHSRAWGFMIGSSFLGMYEERELAPAAWGVVKDGYILRYVTDTEPDLYRDMPEGKSAFYELYNIMTDPGETVDLFKKEPEIAKELQTIWEKEAISLPPPVRWRRDRWVDIMPAGNIYLNKQ